MIEIVKSINGRRSATIRRVSGSYEIELSETRRLGSSVRTKKAALKSEAIEIARKWVRR